MHLLSKTSVLLLTLLQVLSPNSASAQQFFTNITAAAGISGQTGLGHGVAWCDFDSDGDQDVAFSNQDGSGFWLYRNDGGEDFSNVTSAMGLAGQGSGKILWGELTGDQRPDLLLSYAGCRLFRNDGASGFTSVTGSSGLSGTPKGLLDVDNDGALDVLTDQSDQLRWHRNTGNGVFEPPISVGPAADTWTVICFDYDLDNDVDVYVGTYGTSANKLFRNNGDDSFTEVAATAQVAYAGAAHGLTIGDFDNDGWPDIYVGSYSSHLCKMYRNQGDSTFSDVTAATGTNGHNDTRTVSFVDYDNDGWLDIFSSHHNFYTYSNTMQHSNQGQSFNETAVALGLSGEWIGDYFGVGWADINHDGAQDLFAAGHIDKYRLFRNDNCPGNYLGVTLTGTASNRSALGARVDLYAGSNHLMRQVIGASGRQDAHSLELLFGLGAATQVDSLVIHWPSGIVQKTGPWTAGQYLQIPETNWPIPVPEMRETITLSCRPNPFNPSTTIYCEFPGGMTVSAIEIFDTRGHLVRHLTATPAGLGQAQATWNGQDNRGRSLPSGTYLARPAGKTGKAPTAKITLVE